MLQGVLKTADQVIQLNFAPQYLSPEYLVKHRARSERLRPMEEALEREYSDNPDHVRKEMRRLRKEEPEIPRPSIDHWFRHLDHIVKLVGVDHVGLGSDFDGIGATPSEIEDVTSLTQITERLLKRGWSEDNIRKLLKKDSGIYY